MANQTSQNGQSEPGPADVDAIMNRIREDVKRTLEKEAGMDAASRFPLHTRATPPLFDGSVGAILHCEELNFLNARWHDWDVEPEITSHRKGIGPILVRLKTHLASFIWKFLFRDYFEKERNFNRQLVRYLNRVARYVDARDAELFWQLIDKVDNDVLILNDKCDRLYDEVFTSLATIEQDFKLSKEK